MTNQCSPDIVARLRKGEAHGVLIPCEDLKEAADEIERLRRVVAFKERVERVRNDAQAASERLASAEKVIAGVVNSYPVAAGTSKYGYEEDHDGYGWIRECRLWLEAHAPSALSSAQCGEGQS